MKMSLIAVALALALPMGAAHAQASTNTAKKSTAKSSTTAKKSTPKKTTAKKSTGTKSKSKSKVTPRAAAVVEAVTPIESLSSRLTPAELEIAKGIYTGHIPCELGANVDVTADPQNPGFFHVVAGKQRYFMHPVESRTGAVRLEDNRAGALWLQLGNKSMLMNQKLGQRIADDCAAPAQREFAAKMNATPQPGLLDEAPKR